MRGLRAQVRGGRGGARRLARVGRAGVRADRAASRASASPRPTRRRSACSPTSPPGCACTTGRSSSAACSTSSRWASTRPTRWCTRRSGAGSRCCRPTSLASGVLCAAERHGDDLAVRMGLGYVLGVREADVRGIVEERERGGPFSSRRRSRGALRRRRATRSRTWPGPGRATRSARAGGRRCGGWASSVPGVPVRGGTQLALPLETGDAPELPQLTPWERMLADYGSTHVTLKEHPLELLRPRLPEDMLTSVELERGRYGSRVRLAGPRGGAPAAVAPRTASRSCCSRTSSARST